MQNEFSAFEIDLMSMCLSDYHDSPSFKENMSDDERRTVCQTALKKLANPSPMTFFTRKEYSVMFFAVQHFADVMHANGEQLTPEAYTLIDKLYTKAGGTLTHPN